MQRKQQRKPELWHLQYGYSNSYAQLQLRKLGRLEWLEFLFGCAQHSVQRKFKRIAFVRDGLYGHANAQPYVQRVRNVERME